MSEAKPLPCPFCWGEAHTYRNIVGKYVAACRNPLCASIGPFPTKDEAVEAWNARAERECKDVCADVAQFTCSECGFECDLASWITRIERKHHGTPNYCPSCGAKVADEAGE